MIDITPDQLVLVHAILRESIPDAKVWVFGSRTKGSARRGSGLDLAVDNRAPLAFPTTSHLSEAFDEAPLPYRVDVVGLHSIPEEFRAIVERDMFSLESFADGQRLS